MSQKGIMFTGPTRALNYKGEFEFKIQYAIFTCDGLDIEMGCVLAGTECECVDKVAAVFMSILKKEQNYPN